MKITSWVFLKIASRTVNIRRADQVIGGDNRPYMLRWFVVPKNRWFGVYLHYFLRSDDDRAMHDHPFWSMSWLLQGDYTEWTGDKKTIIKQGQFKLRSATYTHRIELHNGKAWSLFFVGPKIREWGFHCPQGWRHWKEFTKGKDGEEVGRGCD